MLGMNDIGYFTNLHNPSVDFNTHNFNDDYEMLYILNDLGQTIPTTDFEPTMDNVETDNYGDELGSFDNLYGEDGKSYIPDVNWHY